jgi:hypothetical protein
VSCSGAAVVILDLLPPHPCRGTLPPPAPPATASGNDVLRRFGRSAWPPMRKIGRHCYLLVERHTQRLPSGRRQSLHRLSEALLLLRHTTRFISGSAGIAPCSGCTSANARVAHLSQLTFCRVSFAKSSQSEHCRAWSRASCSSVLLIVPVIRRPLAKQSVCDVLELVVTASAKPQNHLLLCF